MGIWFLAHNSAIYWLINVVSELKWNYHIEQNISKARKCIGWVTRSREADVMINIYKSFSSTKP